MTFYKEFGQLNVQMINKVPYKAKSKSNQRLTSRCSSALNLLDGRWGSSRSPPASSTATATCRRCYSLKRASRLSDECGLRDMLLEMPVSNQVWMRTDFLKIPCLSWKLCDSRHLGYSAPCCRGRKEGRGGGHQYPARSRGWLKVVFVFRTMAGFRGENDRPPC